MQAGQTEKWAMGLSAQDWAANEKENRNPQIPNEHLKQKWDKKDTGDKYIEQKQIDTSDKSEAW